MSLYAITQSFVWAIVRYLSEELSTSTLFFFRNFIGLITILPLLYQHNLTLFKTQSIRLHLVRAFASFAGGLGIFYALSNTPLTTVVAITFTAPIFASVFACFFLNEAMTKKKIMSLSLGFLGVLTLLRPGVGEGSLGLLAAVIAAIMTAVAFIAVKKLSGYDEPHTVVAYPFIFILPVSALMAMTDWTQPSVAHLPFLVIMGVGISLAQYFMVKALSLADASTVLPIDFVRLIIATIIGTYFFSDNIDFWVLAGGTLILISSLYLVSNKRAKVYKKNW